MKRWCLLLLALGAVSMLSAQEQDSLGGRRGSVKMDWMQPFEGVAVDGPLKVTLQRVEEPDPMHVSYDTKGNPDSRLKVSVDKYGVLNIREKGRKVPTDTTEVKICYRRMTSLRIQEARVRFEEPIQETSLDVKFSGGAVVEAPMEVYDLVMQVTGKSRVVLTGRTHYLDLEVSTAEVDAVALESVSAHVEASHGAGVRVQVSDRLEARCRMADLNYTGDPRIVRTETSLLGGRIEAIKAE